MRYRLGGSLLFVVTAVLVALTLGAHQSTGSDDADTRVFLIRSMPADDIEVLRVAVPNLRIVVGLSEEDALARASEFHGIDGRYCSSAFMNAATNLEWVHSPSAGVDWLLVVPELVENDRVTVTNMAGVHGPTIADHAMGMLLTLTRDLRYYTDPAHQGTWNREGSGRRTMALQDRTMFVVGLGGIGREVARRAKAFGMRVVATRRRNVAPPPFVDVQGTPDRFEEFLAEADVVAICTPLTPETSGMFGEDEFSLMKEGAYLINVGRGGIVDSDSLVAALESGHLAGAALDVTDPEPLPPGHALWSMPNVIITPHVSSRSELTTKRWRELYVENLTRFAQSRELVNIVDKRAGY